jgi:mono/diheme cytochrome c family protein
MISSPVRLAARAIAVAAALLFIGTVRAEAQDSVDWNAYKKSVEAGHRDTIPQNAYQGWKQFELNCSRCHGEYGVGTSFAPALIVSLKDGGTIPDEASFITVVCAGRKDKGMPSWCELGLEMDKNQNIYAYLKLRADGKVGDGRPAPKADG